MATRSQDIEKLVNRKYEAGFFTDLESDTVAPGLDEDVIRFISAKKEAPQWMTDWRLKAFEEWMVKNVRRR